MQNALPLSPAAKAQPLRKFRAAAAVVSFVLFLAVICLLVGKPMMQFVGNPTQFRTWIDGHGIWGRLAFVGMMTAQIIIAFIPGEPLEIAAGYAFGALEGTALCMLGSLFGGLIVFVLVRRFGMRVIEAFFPLERIQEIRFLKDSRRLKLLVFILFFIPGTPKDIMTYCVGLTKISLANWLGISTVARIPSIVTSTLAGNALGLEQYQFAVIVFGIALLFSAVGLLLYKHL
ncbi:MAG: VTT domain-containing protein [Clostridia bacterium]